VLVDADDVGGQADLPHGGVVAPVEDDVTVGVQGST
jgi:hypothetical protein